MFGRVHFVGIGGVGMSGIARIMLTRGMTVSGSDARPSALLDELAALGARVHVGHDAANLDGLCSGDTLVVSSAIRPDNPELTEAGRRGMRVLHRAAALAQVMAGRRVIAVAGTHGKTTTTSMLTTVLRDCGADPGYVIGGVLRETGLGADDGSGLDFVAEADESDASFLALSPDAAILTNVEADHLDNYPDLRAIEDAFITFAQKVTGLVVSCADDQGARTVAERLDQARVRRYGESPSADYVLSDYNATGMGSSFAVTGRNPRYDSSSFTVLSLAVPGRHNALNATAAFAMAVELGFAPPRVAAALAAFRGARRRLEPAGEARGVLVLDTYAHHPTELAADLRATRDIVRGRGGRIIAVFQPHLYSRTRLFAAGFGSALGLADVPVVLDVYAAREDPEAGVTGALVADAVPGGGARFEPDMERVPALVAALARPGDVVLTMGAGDVTKLGPMILEALGE